jgi:hypothetical protein
MGILVWHVGRWAALLLASMYAVSALGLIASNAAAATLNASPTNLSGGNIASSPAGIDCGNYFSSTSRLCSRVFSDGSTVTLTARPQTGWQFTGWSGGNCIPTRNNPNMCVISNIRGAVTVSAAFTGGSRVSLTKTGSGSVTSSPRGISCAAGCSSAAADFGYGTQLTLIANPDSGFVVGGWSGCDGSDTRQCSVNVTRARNVSVNFIRQTVTSYGLTVTKSGSGAGTVTSSPAGINCGSDCNERYTSGQSVTLNATPAAGSSFAGWSGCNSSTGTSCVVSMTAAKTVSAAFNVTPVSSYSLLVNKSGSGTGTVSSSASGINCGSSCSANINSGSTLTLSAVAGSGSTFASWSGCSSTNGAVCSVVMTSNKSVTARFDTVSGYGLTVSKSGSTNALTIRSTNLSGSGGTINCGSTCTANLSAGASVRLSASTTSSLNSYGITWGGCDSTSSTSNTTSCAVSMTSARTVSANISGCNSAIGNASEFTAPCWTTGGASGWSVDATTTLSGGSSVRSGVIGDNQTSVLRMSTNFTGTNNTLYFSTNIKTEAGKDFLVVLKDGTEMLRLSGNRNWETYSFSITGSQSVTWLYVKDSSGGANGDVVRIDKVRMTTR